MPLLPEMQLSPLPIRDKLLSQQKTNRRGPTQQKYQATHREEDHSDAEQGGQRYRHEANGWPACTGSFRLADRAIPSPANERRPVQMSQDHKRNCKSIR
jgi:hypothetical protein